MAGIKQYSEDHARAQIGAVKDHVDAWAAATLRRATLMVVALQGICPGNPTAPLQTLSILVWNTCACIACIWLMNWTVSYNNLFSRSPLCNQPDFEFFMGTVLIVHSAYY
uniref:Uncharacterized protein n=1 Tax=Globisporangium ultimum (strain ATCC 200006 / CBS 805.95 / DAOM BR144) TaxID=431595 RepID=K3WFQ7_GLOUD